MGMVYMKLFYDWLEMTRGLQTEEKGRLIDAMVRYARDGTEDESLTGNERYIFPAFRQRLDMDAAKYRQKCERNPRARTRVCLSNQELSNQELSNEELSNEELSKQESSNEAQGIYRENDHWRTSVRARGAVAQLVVDCCISEELPCGRLANLYDMIRDAMEAGVSPEECMDICREANRQNLGLLLYEAMQARGAL